MNDLRRIILNAIAFNIGWFACVLSSRWGSPLAAIPIIAVILALHLLVITPRHTMKAEALAIAVVAAIGAVVDTLNLSFGVLGFGWPPTVFVPWITCFWLNFACTLNTSLRWLARMPLIAGVLGVVSAPGTYYFGVKLGALELHDTTWIALAVLAVQWLFMLPAMSLLARHIRRAPISSQETHPATSDDAANAPAERRAS